MNQFHYNKYILGGYVTKKSEIITIEPSGDKVMEVTLRCPGFGRDSEGRRQADFFTLEVCKNKAEAMNEKIFVGDAILVDGTIKHERWKNKNDENRYTYKFLVNSFQLVDSQELENQNEKST